MGDGPLREGAPHPERIAQFREQEGREELLRGTLLRRKGGPRADPAPRAEGSEATQRKVQGWLGEPTPPQASAHCRPPVAVSATDSSQKAPRLGVSPAPWARGAPRPCGAALTAAPGHGPRHGPPHPTLRLR